MQLQKKHWPYLLILFAVLYGIAMLLPAYRYEDGERTSYTGFECLVLGPVLIEDSPLAFISWCANVFGVYFIIRTLFTKTTKYAELMISYFMVALASISLFMTVWDGSQKNIPTYAPYLWVLSLLALSTTVWLKQKTVTKNNI
jgi:hypothetical protein